VIAYSDAMLFGEYKNTKIFMTTKDSYVYDLRKMMTSGTGLFMLWILFCLLSANCQAQIQMIDNPAGKGSRLPRLTTMPDGSVLLSWVETVNDVKQNEQVKTGS